MYCRGNIRYVFTTMKDIDYHKLVCQRNMHFLILGVIIDNSSKYMHLSIEFTQADSCFYFHRMILCTHTWCSASIICVYLHTNHFITIFKLHKSVLFCPDDCTITRMTLLLTSFFYRMWFFGAAYYWGTWVFLGVRVAFSQGFSIVFFQSQGQECYFTGTLNSFERMMYCKISCEYLKFLLNIAFI